MQTSRVLAVENEEDMGDRVDLLFLPKKLTLNVSPARSVDLLKLSLHFCRVDCVFPCDTCPFATGGHLGGVVTYPYVPCCAYARVHHGRPRFFILL